MTDTRKAEAEALKAELAKISGMNLDPVSAEALEKAKRIAARMAKGMGK